jgi:hypothetical protein
VASAPDEATEIQREMARIRVELHEDMQGVVAGAEAVASWHRFVKHYPWPSLAVGFAIGYLIVPRKRRSATRTGEAAAHAVVDEVREAVGRPRLAEKAKPRRGLFGMLFGFVGPIALRAAQGYAVQYVENWILQQAAQNPLAAGPFGGGGPPPGSPPQRPR